MALQLLHFIIAPFILFNVSRIGLMFWQRKRIHTLKQIISILKGGLRIDLNQIATFAVLPAIIAPWTENSPTFIIVTGVWFSFWFLVCAFMEVATPQFIREYDSRPNRLFIEYLEHPKEVSTMLWRGYKLTITFTLIALVFFVYVVIHLFFPAQAMPLQPWWLRIIASFVFALIGFICIRGTLKKRPINPSTVTFSDDGLLNSLTLNSIYSLLYAIYAMKYELSAEKVYGKMPLEEQNQLICQEAGIVTDPKKTAQITTTHQQSIPAPKSPPLNIVMIVEESLGAQYVKTLNGQDLTPCLDALYEEGWGFTRAYATGTRSVRGLEALSAGFPPTITQSVFKLPKAQSGFFTIAKALGNQYNYHSRFLYGGEAHFDNMKGFFLGNGFNEVVDSPLFVNPQFKGTWGYSDEDMFAQLDRLLMEDNSKQQPTFTLAFSVSNHTPWEYPSGRIQAQGTAASVENTVRYADYAIGEFFKTAKTRDYWQNTVFLIVADHDSRVFGADLIPLKHFHIPALILGGTIAARRDDRLVSQIDFPVTLLSLAGVACTHPMIGQDLSVQTPNRAIMQYGDRYGYLKGDQLIVLEPHSAPLQFAYQTPESFTKVDTDSQLASVALAHALWPFSMYKNKSYHL